MTLGKLLQIVAGVSLAGFAGIAALFGNPIPLLLLTGAGALVVLVFAGPPLWDTVTRALRERRTPA